MTIDTLSKTEHIGLAGVGTQKLKQMRNQSLRSCFNRFDEMRYRREFVARIHGKTFINDAASRSANSTWYTLESTEGPIIWIANANSKTNNYDKLAASARNKVKMLICVGQGSEAMYKQFDTVIPQIVSVENLWSAVNKALYNDIQEATVVYSPACDSPMPTAVYGEEFHHDVNEL